MTLNINCTNTVKSELKYNIYIKMNTVISKVEHLKEVKLEYYYTMTYIIMLWLCYLQFAILK